MSISNVLSILRDLKPGILEAINDDAEQFRRLLGILERGVGLRGIKGNRGRFAGLGEDGLTEGNAA